MDTLWDVKPSLRRLLADGLAQAAGVLEGGTSAFLAPSFPGMTGDGDCRLLQVPPLPEQLSDEADSATIARWPGVGLLATRWPVMIFVMEGECDVRFGATPLVRRYAPSVPSGCGQYVVTARHNQFLLIPSHFPRPDGGDAHWERPNVEEAESALMWLIFNPAGCFVHFCRTQGHQHTQTKSVYLSAARTFRLMEDVENEVLGGQPQWQAATRNYLENLLLLLQRHISGAQFELGISRAVHKAKEVGSPQQRLPHLALQRACQFIEDHLQESMRVPQIAAAVGISASGLNQLFRKYLQTSTVQYIIDRRIERAKTLLSETNLAVKLIAEQCGFPHLEHFSRMFHRASGSSPLAYRRLRQKSD